MDREFLILDQWPTSRLSRLWTLIKIVIKEGILKNSWYGVRRFGKPFGSRRIPEGLAQSLKAIDVKYRHNVFQPVDTVVAFRDVRCLRWALKMKRQGKIRRLLAGPFIATLPFEYDGILLDSAIDGLLFLSEWHRDMFLREAKKPVPPTHIWSAGIDADYWVPDEARVRDRILIYKKSDDHALVREVIETLDRRQLKFSIIEYGSYSPEDYLKALHESYLCINLQTSETQGISMFEAWSCDVPTLHVEAREMNFLGKIYAGASSCPYLGPSCGMIFAGRSDFAAKLEEMLSNLDRFRPREFILQGHTYHHSGQRFLSIVRKM